MAVFYTTIGQARIVDYIDGTATPGSHTINAGTGAVAAGVASTSLSTVVSESAVAATKSQPSANVNRWVGTQTYTGSKTITNAGVFTEASSVLLLIGDGLSIAVTADDSIQFTFELEQIDVSEV